MSQLYLDFLRFGFGFDESYFFGFHDSLFAVGLIRAQFASYHSKSHNVSYTFIGEFDKTTICKVTFSMSASTI